MLPLFLIPIKLARCGPEGQKTRKPCCRKETARCRSWSFRFKVRRRHSLQAKLRKPCRLQSNKHTSAKQNLTQNGDSRSFKVTCFGVSGKAIRHYVILLITMTWTWLYHVLGPRVMVRAVSASRHPRFGTCYHLISRTVLLVANSSSRGKATRD